LPIEDSASPDVRNRSSEGTTEGTRNVFEERSSSQGKNFESSSYEQQKYSMTLEDEASSDVFDASFELFSASLDSELVANRHEFLRPRTTASPSPSPLSPKPFAKIPIEATVPTDESFNISNVTSPSKRASSPSSRCSTPVTGLPKHVHKHLKDLLSIPIKFDQCDNVILEMRRVIHFISTSVIEDLVDDMAEYGLVDLICKIISRLFTHAEVFYTALRVVVDVILHCSKYDARASFYNNGLVEDLAFGLSIHIYEPMVIEMAAVCASTLASGSFLWKSSLIENSVCDMCVEALRLHYDNATVLERCI
jgi:hypothetical protein